LAVSDRYIDNVIARGIPHEMPAFAKKHDEADRAALIAYLRTLR
jgi:mono/diheme cytochrome c family protein